MKQLEDFAVGDTFRVEREVDRYRSIYYAAASGDFNPIHVDARVARAAGFGGCILQGMCTYAWLADACVEYLDDPARLARLRVRFSRPLQAGDVVTFEGRCTAVEEGTIRLDLVALNQKGEEVLKGAAAEGRVDGGGSGEGSAARPDPAGGDHVGRRYGPFTYAAGREDVRNFVAAVGGGVPGHVLPVPPDRAHPLTWDEEAAGAGPHRGIVAPPGFAAVYAIEPFAHAVSDPVLGLDLVRLVHGEQELHWLEPVRPGDVLTTTGEISRIETRGTLDVVEVTTASLNQRGRPVVRGTWIAVVRG